MKPYDNVEDTLAEILLRETKVILQTEEKPDMALKKMFETVFTGQYKKIAGDTLEGDDRLVEFKTPRLIGYFDAARAKGYHGKQTLGEAQNLRKRIYGQTPCG